MAKPHPEDIEDDERQLINHKAIGMPSKKSKMVTGWWGIGKEHWKHQAGQALYFWATWDANGY